MRTSLLILTLSLVLPPAFAASPVTVQQLEQMLAAAHGKPDSAVAQQLSSIELSQRLSAPHRICLLSDLPGDQSRAALLFLADRAAFLNLPPEDILADPAPDSAEQNRIMALAAERAEYALRKMPAFSADRETTRFEGARPGRWIKTPKAGGTKQENASPTPDPFKRFGALRQVDNARVTVLYRDEHEVIESEQPGSRTGEKPKGMEGWGEFGPFLKLVTSDILKGKVQFDHWERGDSGALAVLRFEVPRKSSHYTVQYCCSVPFGIAVPQVVRDTPEYHGEIAIAPDTGAVLRLVVRTAPREIPIEQTEVAVEYGPVELGGRTYICPLRSVTRSIAQSPKKQDRSGFAENVIALEPSAVKRTFEPGKTLALNHVSFDNYHVYRIELHIVPDAPVELVGDGAKGGRVVVRSSPAITPPSEQQPDPEATPR